MTKPSAAFTNIDLARVEVLEGQREVAVRVQPLLVREHDVEADREPAGLLGSRGSPPPSRPGPPPVTTAKPASAKSARRSRAPCSYVGDSSPTRAEPKIETAGRSISLDLLEAGEELGRDQRRRRSRSSPSRRRSSRCGSTSLFAHSRPAGRGRADHRRARARRRVRTRVERHRRAGDDAAASAGFGAAATGAEDAPRAEDCAAVEEPDRDQVEEVEEEARRRRARAAGRSRSPCRTIRHASAASPPATGPASETRAFPHGSNGQVAQRDVRAEERDEDGELRVEALPLRLDVVPELVDEDQEDEADGERPAPDQRVAADRDEDARDRRETELRGATRRT